MVCNPQGMPCFSGKYKKIAFEIAQCKMLSEI